MITLVGLMLNIVTMAIFLAYDMSYKKALPFWTYLLMAFTVLGY